LLDEQLAPLTQHPTLAVSLELELELELLLLFTFTHPTSRQVNSYQLAELQPSLFVEQVVEQQPALAEDAMAKTAKKTNTKKIKLK